MGEGVQGRVAVVGVAVSGVVLPEGASISTNDRSLAFPSHRYPASKGVKIGLLSWVWACEGSVMPSWMNSTKVTT